MDVERSLQAVTARAGCFHLLVCSLLSTAFMYQALFNLSYVFTTMRSEYRCFIPECETSESLTDMQPPWLGLAVPASDHCLRYAPLNSGAAGAARCSPDAFGNTTVPCERWVYPNKDLSIMTEWDMTCSLSNDMKLSLVGTLNNLGRALGMPVFGLISDAVGRRSALLAGLAVSCCLGLARSFAPNYASFIGLEFLDPVFYDGMGGAGFIVGMELLPPHWRGPWSALSHVVYALGMSLLGASAWLLQSWRLLLRVVYGSALLCLAALFFTPESVRWLASKGRTKDALHILNKAIKMNKMPPLSSGCVATDDLKPPPDPPQPAPRPGLASDMKEFARSRVLVLRLLACCLTWISIMFVYDGLAVYSVSLAGNRYLNFILVELVEVPSALITWRLMNVAGRRTTLLCAFMTTSACCVAYHFLAVDAAWPRTAAVVLAKLCVTVAFTVTYVLSAELFPTKIRHTMYAVSSTCGRLGSALSPQMPLLAKVMDTLPLLVFGAVAFCGGLLALSFPETGSSPLPDSVAEAEAMGKAQREQHGVPIRQHSR